MKLTSITTIKDLLTLHSAAALKSFSQNFLISDGIVSKIIKSTNLNKEDIVLEIGPGIGVLTEKLAEEAKEVISIEKDKKMVLILKETLKEIDNVKIIEKDILDFSTNEESILKDEEYVLVSNLPYSLTAPIIRKFLEEEKQPKVMIFMVQKEVAVRICAEPPKMSMLAIAVQFYADVKKEFFVPSGNFWPKPKVDSAIIKIVPKKRSYFLKEFDLKEDDYNLFKKRFFNIVKAGFSSPRKKLVNNLSGRLQFDKEKIEKILLENNISLNRRAESLTIKDWGNITFLLSFPT